MTITVLYTENCAYRAGLALCRDGPAPRAYNKVMPPSATLYQTLAGEIAGLISAGTLRPGDRIPSVRELSRAKSASVSSVLSAYRVLEDRGLVESRPQSGYYVRASRVGPAEPARTEPPIYQ